MNALPACDDSAIWRIWLSAFHSPALAAADELSLFKTLAQKPATAAQVRSALNLELRVVEALMGLMAFIVENGGPADIARVTVSNVMNRSPRTMAMLASRSDRVWDDYEPLDLAPNRGAMVDFAVEVLGGRSKDSAELNRRLTQAFCEDIFSRLASAKGETEEIAR
jgi:hypothetical protein